MTDAPAAEADPDDLSGLDAALLDELIEEEKAWQAECVRRNLIKSQAIEAAEAAAKTLADTRVALVYELNRWREAKLGPGSRGFHLL